MPSTSAQHARSILRSVVLASVPFALLAGCGGDKNENDSGDEPPAIAGTELADDAPDWCDLLIAGEVQVLAAQLPEVALGNGPESDPGRDVLTGTDYLMSVLPELPKETVDIVENTATSIAAFVNTPKNRNRFNTAIDSLKTLADHAKQECGL